MKHKFISLIPIAFVIIIWAVVSNNNVLPSYILPSIQEDVSVYYKDAKILFDCMSTTVAESFIGLFLGAILGLLFAIAMDCFNIVRLMLYPILVITQSIPVVALAPLVILFFGYNMLPKIFLTSICCFFPVTVSTFNGFYSPSKQYFDLFKTMGASKFQIFKFIKLPFAVPYFVSGLKIATTYAIISAIISEWVGGDSGLGVYMIRAKNSYAFDKLFAVIILICIVSIAFVKLVDVINGIFLSKLNFNNLEKADV